MTTQLSDQIMKWHSAISKATTLQEANEINLARMTKQLDTQEALVESLTAAKTIIRDIGAECQIQVQSQIGTVVTRCLQAVFGVACYKFVLRFVTRRGQTEIEALLIDAEGNELSPLESVGGGVLDVVTFGLRLAAIVLMRPRPAQVMILDEAFRFVSVSYREPLRELLVELSQDLGIQIILVTHMPEFMDDPNIKVIEIQ